MSPSVKEAVLVLCDRVTREPGSNKATLAGLFDQVRVTGEPFPASLTCTLFLRFYVNGTPAAKLPFSLSIQRPTGAIERVFTGTLDLVSHEKGSEGRVESQFAFQNLPLYGEGRHTFIVTTGSTEIGRARFDVLTPGSSHGTQSN